MDLIIFAGGKGTRNSQWTYNSAIPKILVSTGQKTVLERIYDSWHVSDNIKNVYVVVSSEAWQKQVKEIVVLKKLKNTKVIRYDKQDGTFYTVSSVLAALPQNTDYAITWSDIWTNTIHKSVSIAKHLFELSDEPTFVIGQDSNKVHRFDFDAIKETIKEVTDQTGNICGIYFVNAKMCNKIIDADQSIQQGRQDDIIDWLSVKASIDNSISLLNVDITKLNDVGQNTKLIEHLESQNIDARFFNKITKYGEILTKANADDKGYTVGQSEIGWYSEVLNSNNNLNLKSYIPQIHELKIDALTRTTNIVMQLLKPQDGWSTVNEFLSSSKDLKERITRANKVVKQMVAMSWIFKQETIENNLTTNSEESYLAKVTEYSSVLVDRYESVKNILSSVKIKSVFGNLCDITIDDVEAQIGSHLVNDDALVFGHGDCNDSNVMYNATTDEIKLIDPRGQFGGVANRVDPIYEIAKFVYGVTGYSEFNLDKYFMPVVSDNCDLTWDGLIPNPIDLLDTITIGDKVLDQKVKLAVGLIWCKLPQYISNNPTKSIAAWSIGRAIIEKYS